MFPYPEQYVFNPVHFTSRLKYRLGQSTDTGAYVPEVVPSAQFVPSKCRTNFRIWNACYMPRPFYL
jgi:hypothetical protein